MIEIDEDTVGVIIARFQVPELHLGHQFLIEHVHVRYPKTLILLGMAQMSFRDPLTYELRRAMVHEKYGDRLKIMPLPDRPGDDVAWSDQIDTRIMATFPTMPAIIFGSRDSCLPHYKGKHKMESVDMLVNVQSGTDIRGKIYHNPKNTKEFREGVIWASQYIKSNG